jgi:nucleotide sugar dehydrogenase
MKIAIIGAGVVGQGTGCGLSQLGHEVIYYDVLASKRKMLSDKGENVAPELYTAIMGTEICFICVPTPLGDNGIDLSYLETAVRRIAEVLKEKDGRYLIVIKSTVIPGTCDKLVIPILRDAGVNFGLCMNPEFLTEINTSWSDDTRFKRDFWCKERIVIGELNQEDGYILETIYKPIGAPIFRVDLKTAEMTKYAANMMLATKISYWNEIFMVCQELGIDSNKVAQITALDARIGIYGTKHGLAYSGTCLPKDIGAFVYAFRTNKEGYCEYPSVLHEVNAVNKYMKEKYGERK